VKAQAGLSTTQSNLMWSLLSIGAMIGGLVSGPASNRYGRKNPVALAAATFVFAAVLATQVVTYTALCVARTVAGFGVGFTTSIVPLYVAEVAPAHLRGLLGAILQSFIALGLVTASALGLPTATDHLWWKTIYLFSCAPAAVRALMSLPGLSDE
jgi:MFS family permease